MNPEGSSGGEQIIINQLDIVMKRIILIGLLMSGLSGCATQWQATTTTDNFTDETTKMVSINMLPTNLLTPNIISYSPFIGTHNGELFLGLKSSGRAKLPVGTVQIRVDSNPVWTIGTDETPLFLSPQNGTNPTSYIKPNPYMDKEAIKAMTDNIMKIGSPFTAATGGKAKDILSQIIHGKLVKFRVVGINQSATTEGEVQVNEDLFSSLRSIGINPSDY